MVNKVLKAAIADADEQQADVDRLYINEARVDDAGSGWERRVRRERSRSGVCDRKQACHIHLTLTQK